MSEESKGIVESAAVDRVVVTDLREIQENFRVIVAQALHAKDHPLAKEEIMTAIECDELQNGWQSNMRNNVYFRAMVDKTVAQLMLAF